MKLEDRILHVKNVIFLRVLVLVISLIVLVRYLPIYQDDQRKLVERLQHAQNVAHSMEAKLKSFSNFGSEIFDINEQYELYRDHGYDLACVNGIEFKRRVQEMKAIFKLDGEIKIATQNNVKHANTTVYDKVMVHSDISSITFSIADLDSFHKYVTYIKSILPQYAFIKSVSADMQEVLTPQAIGALEGQGGKPSLIFCTIVVQLPEITIPS